MGLLAYARILHPHRTHVSKRRKRSNSRKELREASLLNALSNDRPKCTIALHMLAVQPTKAEEAGSILLRDGITGGSEGSADPP